MITFKRVKRLIKKYAFQVNFFERFLFCLIGAFFLTEFVRSYLVEINIFQLRPALYFNLILIGFILLVIITSLSFLVPIQEDYVSQKGARSLKKLVRKRNFKSAFILFQIAVYFSFFVVIPISLEAIVQYSNTEFVEELWAFEELREVLTILMYLIIFLLQVPVVTVAFIDKEEIINYLPNNLKKVNFFVCVAAGMITPTVDIPTQINFIFIGIFLYAYTYFMTSKEISIETEILI